MQQEIATIKVIIADTQFLITEALANLLGSNPKYCISGIVQSKYDFEKMLLSLNEGVIITDIFSLDFESLNDFKNLMLRFPCFNVLILTNAISKTDFVELSKAGFKNILYKTTDRNELFMAIDSCQKGKKHYSSELLELMLDLNSDKFLSEDSKVLTASEIEIVRLISKGLTTKEIAQKKNVSFHTVNTHRKNIFRKMGVSNASELVMTAIKSGWIDTIEYYI